jgi:hypothetical protein
MQDPWVIWKKFGSFPSNIFTQHFQYFQIVNVVYQRHQTILRFLSTAATTSTRWRVRELYCQTWYGYRNGGTQCLHLQSVSKRCHNPEYHTLCPCMFYQNYHARIFGCFCPKRVHLLTRYNAFITICTRHWCSCSLTANINHTEIHRWKLIMLHNRIS